MIVGTEWLIEAIDCDANALRNLGVLQSIFARIKKDLQLKVINDPLWHQFESAENGITGFAMLTESHFACHTYPEHKIATFNLYCCRERPEWNWSQHLSESLGAKNICIQKIERGDGSDTIKD